MAVEAAAASLTATAQYQYQHCFPDFRARAPTNLLDELQMLQRVNNNNNQQLLFNTGAVASGGTQHSGLTSDASGNRRKRGIEEVEQQQQQQHQQSINFVAAPGSSIAQKSRLLDSMGASTSGSASGIHNNVNNTNIVVSLLTQDVSTLLGQQSAEIDALIRLQNERLRGVVEEATKNHQRALMAVVDQRVAKRLRAKEAELAQVIKKNADLEEKVRQAIAESQFWFGAARNAEALACTLRASLEQTLLHPNNNRPQQDDNGKEECGDSDCYVVEADDAQSCCFDEEEQQRRHLQRQGGEEGKAWCCRSCGGKDVCVLLLPCRHLCICKECEPKVNHCPVCRASKNASLRVFMS